jgi:hypothetical protein
LALAADPPANAGGGRGIDFSGASDDAPADAADILASMGRKVGEPAGVKAKRGRPSNASKAAKEASAPAPTNAKRPRAAHTPAAAPAAKRPRAAHTQAPKPSAAKPSASKRTAKNTAVAVTASKAQTPKVGRPRLKPVFASTE